jgi:hypothetical protein
MTIRHDSDVFKNEWKLGNIVKLLFSIWFNQIRIQKGDDFLIYPFHGFYYIKEFHKPKRIERAPSIVKGTASELLWVSKQDLQTNENL